MDHKQSYIEKRVKKMEVQSDVVEPIDKVEQWENRREDDPWPPVNGVHICQIRDFDLELWGPPPQATAFQLGGAVQGVAAGRARPRSAALLAVLDVRRGHAVQLHHRLWVSNVRHTGGDLASRHFIMDLQGSEQDVPLAVWFCLSGQREMRELIKNILCKQMGQQTRMPSKVLMHFQPLYNAVKTMKCRCSHAGLVHRDLGLLVDNPKWLQNLSVWVSNLEFVAFFFSVFTWQSLTRCQTVC